MGTRQLQEPVSSLEKYIQVAYDNGSFNQTEIEFKMDEQLNTITKDINEIYFRLSLLYIPVYLFYSDQSVVLSPGQSHQLFFLLELKFELPFPVANLILRVSEHLSVISFQIHSHVAVSDGGCGYNIHLIDVDCLQLTRSIDTGDWTYGMTCHGGSLIYSRHNII
jgi:hypothetical protein